MLTVQGPLWTPIDPSGERPVHPRGFRSNPECLRIAAILNAGTRALLWHFAEMEAPDLCLATTVSLFFACICSGTFALGADLPDARGAPGQSNDASG